MIRDRLAEKRSRATGEDVWGPNEVRTKHMTMREVLTIWSRPFYMLVTEPIVAWLSAVSGFSDNLIFIFLQGFHQVYKQCGFGTAGISLAFLPYRSPACLPLLLRFFPFLWTYPRHSLEARDRILNLYASPTQQSAHRLHARLLLFPPLHPHVPPAPAQPWLRIRVPPKPGSGGSDT